MDVKNEVNNILEDIRKHDESLSLSLSGTLLNVSLSLDSKLLQLCLQLPKLELNVNDVYILWLRNENETTTESLNGIDIKLFYTNNGLINFISETQTNNLFIIIDQDLVSNILSFLDDFPQVLFIYILTDEDVTDDISTGDFKRLIRKICHNKNELFRSIKEDIDIYTKDYISTSIFDLQTEQESTNLSFLWYHLLINSLFDLTLSYQTSKDDFIKYCREQYSIDNIQQQTLISEFENEYSSKDAIRWYTRDSFIYRLLNKALRTRDIDLISTFRFFIIDFQNQLEQYCNEEIPEFAYRGQQLSPLEFNQLKNSIGKYISINTYLSASVDKHVAMSYASHPSSVLFVIDTSNAIHMKNKRTRPVYIQDKSYSTEEFEIVFPMGSTFRLDSMWKEDNQWYVKLIVSNNDNYEQLFGAIQEIYIAEVPSTIKFARLLISSGEYDKAERYLQIFIKDFETSNEDILKGYVYNYMGAICTEREDYNSALSWYQNALNYEQDMHLSARVDLYLNFGNTYSLIKKFDKAFVYLNQALDICHSNQLGYHRYISTYISLAMLYGKKSNYIEALRLLEEALHGLGNLVPETHRYFVFLYVFFGHMCCECRDYTSAMISCEKALELKEMINPFTYVFLCTTLVNIYSHNNDIINRFYYAQEAYHSYKKIANNIARTSVIQMVHVNMGAGYYLLGDFTAALEILFKGLEFIDEVNDKFVVFIFIARIFIAKNDVTMAFNYLNKSFELISKMDLSITNIKAIADMNYEYSCVYKMENNLEKAIVYAKKALRLNEENQNYTRISLCCELLSQLCPDKENIYINKLIEIIQEYDLSDNDKQLYHTRIGLYLRKENNYSQALAHYQSALRSLLRSNPPCYYTLILSYANIGDMYNYMEPKDLDLVLFYYEKCVNIYSELLNMEEIPQKDKEKMLFAEGYILNNVKESSLLTSRMFIIYYSIGNYYIEKGNNKNALVYIQKAERILTDYQGKKEMSRKEPRYYILGSAYQSVHDYNQAIFFYKKSIACISNDYNQYGNRYWSLGGVYRDKKDYFMSISIYNISLTFLHNSSSINYEYLARSYSSAALLYELIKTSEYAFIYCKQAIRYYLLCNTIDYDSILSAFNLGAISLWKSKPWNYKEVLEFLQLGKEFSRYNVTNNTLREFYSIFGLFYMFNEDYDNALLYYTKSLEYSISTDDISRIYEKIWAIYMFIGDLDKAYDIIKNSIANQFNAKILDVTHISTAYINMGITYYRFGKFGLAFHCYRTAFYFLRAFQTDKTHGNYGYIYNHIGLIYLNFGNIPHAIEYCLKSRDILCLEKNQEFLPIYSYISLGLIECHLGNYYIALDYFGHAWELIYNNNRYYNLAYKTLFNHIGFVYYKLGQIELAMQFCLKSLSMYTEYNHHPDLAHVHKNLGLIYGENPETYSLALSSYKRALELVLLHEHPDYILFKSMIITLKLKMRKERKGICCNKRTCQLL